MCGTREWEDTQTCQITDTNCPETLERRRSAYVVVGRDSYPLVQKKTHKDWNNLRGIVLLKIASKIHALLLNRALRDLSDRLLP